jgi:hypothetical protein
LNVRSNGANLTLVIRPTSQRVLLFASVFVLVASVALHGRWLPVLLWSAFQFSSFLRTEKLVLTPAGLKCPRSRQFVVGYPKFFAWEIIENLSAAPDSKYISFTYPVAPFLGTQFVIGMNLTREETPHVVELLRAYQASAVQPLAQ